MSRRPDPQEPWGNYHRPLTPGEIEQLEKLLHIEPQVIEVDFIEKFLGLQNFTNTWNTYNLDIERVRRRLNID